MANSWNAAIIGEKLERLEGAVKTQNTISSTEALTGETWVNGKPIYRQVVSVIMPADITDGTYKTIVATVNDVEEVVEMTGIVTSSVSRYEVPYISSDGYVIKVQFNTSTSKLVAAANGATFSSNLVKVILKYTKVDASSKNIKNIEDPEEPEEIKQEEK